MLSRINSRLLSVIVLLPIMIACRRTTTHPNSTMQLRLDAGATILVDAVPTLRLSPPAADGRSEGFGEVRGAATLHDGSIAVVDADVPAGFVFSAEGTLSGTFGRGGAGPGEFREPVLVGVIGDTIIVYDPPQRRLQRFLISGAHLSTVELPPIPGSTLLIYALRDGAVLLKRTQFTASPGPDGLVPAVGQLLRVEPASGRMDTLATETDGLWLPRGFRFFSWQFLVSADDSVVWLGRGDRSLVTRMTQQGQSKTSCSWDASRRAVTDQDRAAATTFAQTMRAAPDMTAPDRFSDSMPVFSRLMNDPTGGVWVVAASPPGATPDSAWRVDPACKSIAPIDLPVGFRLLEVGPTHILGVLEAEDGATQVVRFAITRKTS